MSEIKLLNEVNKFINKHIDFLLNIFLAKKEDLYVMSFTIDNDFQKMTNIVYTKDILNAIFIHKESKAFLLFSAENNVNLFPASDVFFKAYAEYIKNPSFENKEFIYSFILKTKQSLN